MNELVVALMMSAAALPLPVNPGAPAAPPGGPETRYCLRVDPVIGSRIETIQCRTREGWWELGVNVDREWADNGVRVIA
jgi:hypothetical protein